jgi:hypothetical protein
VVVVVEGPADTRWQREIDNLEKEAVFSWTFCPGAGYHPG